MRLIFTKKTFSKVLSNKWKVSVLFVYTTERIPIAVGYSNTQRQSLKKKFFCRCVSLMIYSISLLRRQFYNACKRYRSMLGEKKNWFDSLRRKITRLKGINLKRNLLTNDWIRAYFLIAIWYLIQEKMICIYCCWIRFGNLWFICKSFLWDWILSKKIVKQIDNCSFFFPTRPVCLLSLTKINTEPPLSFV